MSRYAVVIDRVPVVSAVDAVVDVMETTPVPVLKQEVPVVSAVDAVVYVMETTPVPVLRHLPVPAYMPSTPFGNDPSTHAQQTNARSYTHHSCDHEPYP